MRATSPYNWVSEVRPGAEGVEAWTCESGGTFRVMGIARFSPRFALEHVAWGSGWNSSHRELERAGKLDHAAEDCPARDRPPRVREWTPESGWRDVTPEDARLARAEPVPRAGRQAGEGR
jgi:hypothetical protein